MSGSQDESKAGAIGDGPGPKEVGGGTTSDWPQFPNQGSEPSGRAAISLQSPLSPFGAVPAFAGGRAASQSPGDEALVIEVFQMLLAGVNRNFHAIAALGSFTPPEANAYSTE